jgi:hypothetical protein
VAHKPFGVPYRAGWNDSGPLDCGNASRRTGATPQSPIQHVASRSEYRGRRSHDAQAGAATALGVG